MRARGVAGVFISHCEPEDRIVARDLLVAAESGKRWHLAHLSTRDALELVQVARAGGTHVTCEATPHHLTFTDADGREIGPAARVNPPLRSQADVAALRQGVRDGTVDALASDHAPHTEAEKMDAANPAPGFTGLEIAVGAYAGALPDLPMMRFVELLSTNPARILGIDGGTLRPGAVSYTHLDVYKRQHLALPLVRNLRLVRRSDKGTRKSLEPGSRALLRLE